MVTIGIIAMFAGYVLLALPLGSGTLALACMFSALLVISTGTGLFKGNLQVMVGNLYDSPEYASKRDSAFSIFYMAINIGALFALSLIHICNLYGYRKRLFQQLWKSGYGYGRQW